MEWGIGYLLAALALIGLGLWAGLSMRQSEVEKLTEQLAAQKVANEALRRQGHAAVEATGKALQNVLARRDVPDNKFGVIELFGGTSDPYADTPTTGTPRPGGSLPKSS